MVNKEINASAAPHSVGAYPHGRRVGNLLFLSGIGPREAGSDNIPGNVYDKRGNLLSYDIAKQCISVFENVREVLKAAGARWEDLVDVTVFLTNMKDDFSTYNRLYAEYFQSARPCRTTVEISSLPTPIAIELKCIAYLEQS